MLRPLAVLQEGLTLEGEANLLGRSYRNFGISWQGQVRRGCCREGRAGGERAWGAGMQANRGKGIERRFTHLVALKGAGT